MKESFGEVHGRIDRVLLHLDQHIADTNLRFREVDERFEQIDKRFEQIDKRFDKMDVRFDSLQQNIIEVISTYSTAIENMLDNHERRINVLEEKDLRQNR